MVPSIEPVQELSTGPLLALRYDGSRPLGEQVEDEIRRLIREGALPRGSRLPSTRALAADCGISRGVVVRAYAQLTAEGFIATRRGAAPVVAASGRALEPLVPESDVPIAGLPYLLRPDLPDLALFPRADWQRACRRTLAAAVNTDLSYGDPFGSLRLRQALVPFLARTRGVVADDGRTGIFSGSTQALFVIASTLAAQGKARIAVEDPSHRWRTRALSVSGLELVPVPVDEHGLCVDALPDVDAVVVSPDNQFPTGTILSPERRRALVDWAAAGDRLVIEHDYDAHLRYLGVPGGAIQALAPEHVVYVGSASALLAPTVRLGWAVLPARLVPAVAIRMFATAIAATRLSQLALAEMIERGYLDRHLRRATAAYARRRGVLLRALARHLPGAILGNAPVGLFVPVRIAGERQLLRDARRRGYALDGVNEHTLTKQPSGLVLGFAASPEPTLQRAIARLFV
jgi:GntR family transcriptional regulator/MocR family aminotransferase